MLLFSLLLQCGWLPWPLHGFVPPTTFRNERGSNDRTTRIRRQPPLHHPLFVIGFGSDDPLANPPISRTFASSSSNNNNANSTVSSPSSVATAAAGGATTTAGNLRKKGDLRQFSRYLEVECWKQAELRGLEPVLQAVADACKQINRIVQRAQTDDIYGVAVDALGNPLEETNIQGEVQQKLDVITNDLFLRAFCGSSRCVHAVASEEEDEPRCCSDVMNDQAFATGEFVAVFDPLDGSKNIDASLPVGSIFGIYRPPPGTEINGNAFLHGGSTLVAAGYCLYSATTVLVLTLGSGVDGFTLDPDTGRFLRTMPDLRIPSTGPILSFNEANYRDFDEPVRRYLSACKEGAGARKGAYVCARYMGALVADAHNVLINGGIYGYPATFKNRNGKLRLMYESNPMAMIMEQAGGAGSTGFGRILNVKPKDIHQRVPTFLGSIENVYELDQFCKYYSEKDENQQRYE